MELHCGFAKGDPIFVMDSHGNGYPSAINKSSIATTEIDQIKISCFRGL
jgi:hypothetical protein